MSGGRGMDASLLRKAALQSLALMIAVITFSYAVGQYQTVTIAAVNINSEDASNTSSTSKTEGTPLILDNGQIDGELALVQSIASGEDQNINQKLGKNYLVIKKPLGNNLNFNLEDQYINKSILLTITGISENEMTSNMVSRFRDNESFIGEPKYIETTTIETDEEEGSQEVITKDYGKDLCHNITITMKQDEASKLYTAEILIELDSVYAYIKYEDADNYYIDLRKPSEVYDKILLIDAGHGGKDAGALSRDNNYYEKNINLAILLDLKELLDQEDIKVYYTRTGDDKVFLRPRAELANAVDCDYFISIHCNANSVTSPNGSEVLYYNKDFKDVKASDLAELFSEELGKAVTLTNRGTIQKHGGDIFIMDKAVVPMVLIEVGYMTNSNDMDYLSKDENRKAVAKGIYNGIMRAYNELPVKEGQ